MERRKVLFTAGMSNDFMLIITDAPKDVIESYCFRINKAMEEGGHPEPFDTLKTQYYVKELLDSEIDDEENVEIIGYDESYNLCDYCEEQRRKLYVNRYQEHYKEFIETCIAYRDGRVQKWARELSRGALNEASYVLINVFGLSSKEVCLLEQDVVRALGYEDGFDKSIYNI